MVRSVKTVAFAPASDVVRATLRAVASFSAAALIGVCLTPSVRAQSLTLDTFRPAETPDDGFAVSRPDDRGHLKFAGQLVLDYAYNPLVWESMDSMAASESAAIVEHSLTGHAVLSLGLFDRLVLFAALPVQLWSQGTFVAASGAPGPDGAGLGDLWFGARARLFGESHEVFALALQFAATAPTAQLANANQRWTGDSTWGLHPEILAELRPGDVRITLNVGARLRVDDNARVANLRLTHDLTYGLALSIPIVRNRFRISCQRESNDGYHDVVGIHVEGYGAVGFEDFGNRRETSPLEAIAGLRIQPVRGFVIGLAGGTGLTRGYGSPDFRGVFSLGFADPALEPVECVPPEPPPPPDTDRDGLLDSVDQCPREPEDVDQFEDENGCPDPDNDQDGVLDAADGAPLEPEDIDQFEDADGVPDPDNDHDNVFDTSDQCPNDPEDPDGFEDADGCPDRDNDRDGVPDTEDRCPFEPGVAAPGDQNGCPRSVRLDRETGTIVILQRVEFATGRDRILDSSFPVLDDVQAVLRANPQITRIRIEGHTDDRGRDDRNLELSRRRASSVVRWLVDRGIGPSRLEGWGCGELHPIDSNRTAPGRQANRRVEFQVLEPHFAGAPPTREGCVQSD